MKSQLISALSQVVPKSLAEDLVKEFVAIRKDVVAGRTGGGAPGKFVETVAQVLQQLSSGHFDKAPNVDQVFRSLESSPSQLDDGLRICMPRVGRAMYALRNKRAIVHKGTVDPNSTDLAFLHAGAQWIVTELLRHASGLPMDAAAALVRGVQAPVGGLVEDYGDRKLVLAEITTREELLLVLHARHPEATTTQEAIRSVDRRKPQTVRNTLRDLWNDRLAHGDARAGYTLTGKGLKAAVGVLSSLEGSGG